MIQDGIAALHELGSIEYARTKAEEYHQHAHSCLDRLPDGPAISHCVNSLIYNSSV